MQPMETEMPKAAVNLIDETSIREHAYYLWERDGRPFGRDHEFWIRARSELEALAAPKPARTKIKASDEKPKKAAAPAAAKVEPKVVDAVAPRKVRAAAKAKIADAVAEPVRSRPGPKTAAKPAEPVAEA